MTDHIIIKSSQSAEVLVHDSYERGVVPFLRVVEKVIREKTIDANDQLEVVQRALRIGCNLCLNSFARL